MKDEIVGREFLNLIGSYEEECRRVTEKRVPNLGKKATAALELLGGTLSMLDSAGSCHFGCAGGDHRIEYLIGRAANNTYSGILLLQSGYYDQALSVGRNLGEIANLLSLFCANTSHLDRWKLAQEGERRREYSAVKVRLALEELAAPIPVGQDRYRQLSGYSIHADPNSLPQAHNPLGNAVTAPIYQEAGFLLGLNELVLPIAFISVFTARLLDLPKEAKDILLSLAEHLIETFGGVNVGEKGRPWFKLN